MKKILIVGAGLSGAVIARKCAEDGIIVDVIDKRSHIAGNCYDYYDSNNVLIHKYGPHLFHTSDKEVFEFLSVYTDWIEYKHKVKALLDDGSYVTMPVNKETRKKIGDSKIIDVLFLPYTQKMWGLKLSEVNRDVLNRVKIRDDENEYYFPDDIYQALPKCGYTNMINNILNHVNINIKLSVPFDKNMLEQYDYCFNSMPIDEFYGYAFGMLPYRSIKFETYTIPVPSVLPVATVNFTHNGKYTRVTEWGKLPNCNMLDNNYSTLTAEIPCDFEDNNNERYYPVLDSENKNINLYKKYAEIYTRNMTFIGRTGLYKYFDMDDAVRNSLDIANNFLKK